MIVGGFITIFLLFLVSLSEFDTLARWFSGQLILEK